MPAQVESIAWVAQDGPPWHKLGTSVDGLQTAEEMLRAAGLDWTVSRQPMQYRNPLDGQWVKDPDRVRIVRDTDGAPLGCVGKTYQPVQNQDAFSFFDAVTANGEAKYSTAGSLMGGKKVWMLAEIPGNITVAGVDDIKRYLLFANGHDGYTSVNMAVTPVRVVCYNTLSIALAGAQSRFRMKHTQHVEEKIEEARAALGIAVTYYQQFSDIANQLAKVDMPERRIRTVLARLFPDREDDKGREKIAAQRQAVEALMDAPTNSMEGIRGTAWALVNAAVEYADWYAVDHRTDEQRVKSVWYGQAADLADRAMRVVVDEALG